MLHVVGVPSLDGILQRGLLPGQRVKVRIGVGIGGIDLVQAFEGVDGLLHALLDVGPDIFFQVELWLLWQIADVNAGLGPGLAGILLVDPRHDAQQGGLSRTVEAEHPDFGAGEKGQGYVGQDLAFGRYYFTDAVHGKNILRHRGVNLHYQLGCDTRIITAAQ